MYIRNIFEVAYKTKRCVKYADNCYVTLPHVIKKWTLQCSTLYELVYVAVRMSKLLLNDEESSLLLRRLQYPSTIIVENV